MRRILVLLFLSLPALAQPDARAILHRALDTLRGPALEAELVLEVKRPGRTTRYRLFLYTDGKNRALVRVLAPARMAGQGYLMLENRILLFDPRFRRVLELPPSGKSQRFLGSDLAFEDLAGRSLETDYAVELASEDAARLTLALTPRPEAPTPYGRLVLVLEKPGLVPLELTFFDQRGTPVKRARFTGKKPLRGGKYLITEGLVEDLLHPGWQTAFRYEKVTVLKAPDPACFTLRALEEGCP